MGRCGVGVLTSGGVGGLGGGGVLASGGVGWFGENDFVAGGIGAEPDDDERQNRSDYR